MILRFPASTCNSACGCPGNTPDIPLPTLQTFLRQGGMMWSGSALAVGTGHGTWEELGDNNYTARFKFFIFDLATGLRTGSEVVTKDIVVTGPDTFEATSTFDFFDGEGNLLASGCIINETGTSF